jgi:hypothetical protein
MPGIKHERRSIAPPTVGQGTETGIGPAYEAGSRVVVICRFAEALINGTTAPALRQWEGPYLRIRPSFGNVYGTPQAQRSNQKIGRGNRSKAGESFVFDSGTQTPAGPDDIFYDVDAFGQGAIYLPFPASLSLYSECSGNYIFDTWEIPPEYNQPPQYRQELVQTRGIRAGETRTITVPFGAVWMRVTGPAANTVVNLWAEDTGKVVGNGSSVVAPLTATGDRLASRQVPVTGVRAINMTPAVDTQIAFGIVL